MRARISLLVGLLAVFAVAQEAVKLVRAPKLGEIATYAMKLDLDFGASKVTVTGKFVDRVVKVEANGQYTVETTYIGTKVKVKEAENDVTQPPDTLVMKPTGEVVQVVAPIVDPSMVRLANLLAVRLPDGPVKVGDGWTWEVKADAKSGAAAAKAEFKVTGREKIGNYDCLVVKEKYREVVPVTTPPAPEGSGTDSTLWIAVTDGILVKREGTLTNLPNPNPNIKQSANAKIWVQRDQMTAAPLPPIHKG